MCLYPNFPRLPPLPSSTSPASLGTAQAWVFLKETVDHALKQTGDLYKGLYCWNLHSLSVMSASKTPVTSFSPPWRYLLDSVSLIFTVSQSECMGSWCVSWRSRVFLGNSPRRFLIIFELLKKSNIGFFSGAG